MDADRSFRERFLNLIAVPIGLLLLVPLAVLFVLWLYLAALREAALFLWRNVFGRKANAF